MSIVKVIDYSKTVSTGIQYCDECLCKIRREVKYVRGIYRWYSNEKIDIFRRCPDCQSIAELLIIHQRGELYSDLSKAICDGRVSTDDKKYEALTPKARRKVDDMLALHNGYGI